MQIRASTKTIVGNTRKDLLKIADSIEKASNHLFSPPLFRAYKIYILLLSSPNQNYEVIATTVGASPATVQQTIHAMREGGVAIAGSSKPAQAYTIRSCKGAQHVNDSTLNDDRAQEVRVTVAAAVAKLQQENKWEFLTTRQKIALLQQETREARGVAVSTQTLYKIQRETPHILGLGTRGKARD